MLILERILWGVTALVLLLLMRRSRLKHLRLDALRKASNQAIIHDLKNPMTSIMGCLSYLALEEAPRDKQLKLLKLALHSCRAQMTLLETLVDANRLESDELALDLKPTGVSQLLDEAIGEALGMANYLGVKLIDKRSPSLPDKITVDAALLSRVLANLLNNSLKYTPAGGSVTLDVDYAKGSIVLKLIDTGIGISPENIKKLFGKYYRIEGHSQKMRRGSGLGLYFCRLVVEAHGGTIGAAGGESGGTTIEFSIPQPPIPRSLS